MAQLSPKDPDSEEFFNWDCTAMIQSAAGGTIASIVTGPFQENGEGDGAWTLLEGPVTDASGLIIGAKLGGCTAGVDYALTVRFRTTMGELLDHTIRFSCINALD
jgi:hypothetical protein